MGYKYIVTLLITLLITTHEPPSRGAKTLQDLNTRTLKPLQGFLILDSGRKLLRIAVGLHLDRNSSHMDKK